MTNMDFRSALEHPRAGKLSGLDSQLAFVSLNRSGSMNQTDQARHMLERSVYDCGIRCVYLTCKQHSMAACSLDQQIKHPLATVPSM